MQQDTQPPPQIKQHQQQPRGSPTATETDEKNASSCSLTAEENRLLEEARREQNWKRWGPYLSDRQWGTVREDYSPNGDAWGYFPHDHARSRAYRWGEDGLIGFTDRECRLCFAPALWNGKDGILKERLFGLSNPEVWNSKSPPSPTFSVLCVNLNACLPIFFLHHGQGNHGEDVKECYYYLDSSPTHSYMKALYKYPQREYPYRELIEENGRRGKDQPEFELVDTGVFDDDRYFDLYAEYAKESPDDILIKLTIVNNGPEAAELHVLPTFWFRNTWIWGCTHEGCTVKPNMRRAATASGNHAVINTWHETLGEFQFAFEGNFASGDPCVDAGPNSKAADSANPHLHPAELIFVDNHTNDKRLYGSENPSKTVKDGFHEYIVNYQEEAIDRHHGTKCAAHYHLKNIPPNGGKVVLRARLYPKVYKSTNNKE